MPRESAVVKSPVGDYGIHFSPVDSLLDELGSARETTTTSCCCVSKASVSASVLFGGRLRSTTS